MGIFELFLKCYVKKVEEEIVPVSLLVQRVIVASIVAPRVLCIVHVRTRLHLLESKLIFRDDKKIDGEACQECS